MLAENLKSIRESKGYSKVKLSKMSGVSRKTIEFIENKKIINPKLSTVEKLAQALVVPVKRLFK